MHNHRQRLNPCLFKLIQLYRPTFLCLCWTRRQMHFMFSVCMSLEHSHILFRIVVIIFKFKALDASILILPEEPSTECVVLVLENCENVILEPLVPHELDLRVDVIQVYLD